VKKNLFLKRWLLQGIIIALPIVVTVIVFYYLIIYTDQALWFLWDFLPWDILPFEVNAPKFPGLGLAVVTSLLVLTGALTESYLVTNVIKLFNSFMSKVPVIRGIYSTVLKVAQSTLGNFETFSKVVLIEYPRKGVYTLAFKTGDCSLSNYIDGKDYINVFFPTTPNPTSGFYLILPAEEVKDTDLTTEEAFKLIISAGIVQN
jgi:uncharacterized membrane protein